MSDTQDMLLLQRAVEKIGSKKALAEELKIGPSAISNWVKSREIPKTWVERVAAVANRGQAAGREGGVALATRPPAASRFSDHAMPPEQLRVDAQRCGYWAEAAWNWIYVADPKPGEAYVDAEIWRVWSNVNTLYSTIFRHHPRYRPLKDTAGVTDHSGAPSGFGFLDAWRPPVDWSLPRPESHALSHEGVTCTLPQPGRAGGYHFRAVDAIFTSEDAAARGLSKEDRQNGVESQRYEFVTFKAECPVISSNIVISLPQSLKAGGVSRAARIATDYSDYRDIAAKLDDDRYELQDIVRPWGAPLIVDTFDAARVFSGNSWATGDEAITAEIRRRFSDDHTGASSRRVYHVTDEFPQPLTTSVCFWRLPTKVAKKG